MPGMFAIFTLQDIHMPCLAVDKPESVRKVIVARLPRNGHHLAAS